MILLKQPMLDTATETPRVARYSVFLVQIHEVLNPWLAGTI